MVVAMLAAGLSTLGASGAEPPVRVLLFTGGHGFEREPLDAMWQALDGLVVREVVHPHALEALAPEHRDSFDVLALYDMPQEISEQEKVWFTDTLRAGRGLLVLHHAVASYQDWVDYAMIVGGRYLTSPRELAGNLQPASSYQEDVPYTVEPVEGHPLVAGLPSFDLVDETYGGVWTRGNIEPMLTVDHPLMTRRVGWTTTWHGARVATILPGHGRNAFGHPTYRELLRRAALWCAGRLDGDQGEE